MILALIGAAFAWMVAQVLLSLRSGESKQRLPKGNFLVVDTETTGIPDSGTSPEMSDHPRMVQVSWVLVRPSGQELNKETYVVYPDGFRIPDEAATIHGINTEKATDIGKPVKDVLKRFSDTVDRAHYLVAHNVDFDYSTIRNEGNLAGIRTGVDNLLKICTMKQSTEFCKIGPKRYREYKWPSLRELHQTLFDDELDVEHEAEADVQTCLKCFKALYNRRIISLPHD